MGGPLGPKEVGGPLGPKEVGGPLGPIAPFIVSATFSSLDDHARMVFMAHSKDLRKGRYSEAGQIYFITSSCKDRRPIFQERVNALILLQECEYQQQAGDCKSLAIVVMPDHFHWMLELQEGRTLQQIVGSMKGRSARHINGVRGRTGRIWQPGFHDHALRTDESLRATAEYLLHNPVRAGLASQFVDYPYWRSVWHSRG